MKKKPREETSAQERFGEELDKLVSSIDRSRKRNLSEGLLRGDQVADRLAVQEASASPSLKRPKAAMALTRDEFLASMRDQTERLTTRLDNLDSSIHVLKGDLTKVNHSVRANTQRIEGHDVEIKTNRERLTSLEEEVRRSKLPPAAGQLPAAASVWTMEEAAYLLARRSLRVWPIPGDTRAETWKATGKFFSDYLQLPDVTEQMIEKIHKPDVPSGPGTKSEMIVVFKHASTRDSVMGASAKLAPFTDTSGRPTAGLRLEVPPSLRVSFAILYKYGQMLRTRHGQGLRRHVKFDDIDMTLYLNIKLPGDEKWSRVSLEVARRGMKARDKLASDELERRLDMGGDGRQEAQKERRSEMDWSGPSSSRQ